MSAATDEITQTMGCWFCIQVERTHQALWFSPGWNNTIFSCGTHSIIARQLLLSISRSAIQLLPWRLLSLGYTYLLPKIWRQPSGCAHARTWKNFFDLQTQRTDLLCVLDSWHSWMTNNGSNISWQYCTFCENILPRGSSICVHSPAV